MTDMLAVLTGDIVDSSRRTGTDRKKMLEVMRRAGLEMNAHYPNALSSEIDIFRGDSWQMLVRRPAAAVRIAIHFRAFLMAEMESLDSRVSIGIGTVDFMPGTRVSEGDGSAYRRSGQALEALDRSTRMALILDDLQLPEPVPESTSVIMSLVDLVVTSWTGPQAKAVIGELKGLTQEDIAAAWPNGAITQQAVNKHLKRAGWASVAEAVDFLERLIASHLES